MRPVASQSMLALQRRFWSRPQRVSRRDERRRKDGPVQAHPPVRSACAGSAAPVEDALLAAAVGGFAALAAGLCRQCAILGEASLLAGDASSALAGDLALALRIHRGEATPGGSGAFVSLALRHCPGSL